MDGMTRQQIDRLQRLVDSTDGNDLDPTKVKAYFKKNQNQWDMPDGGPPGHDYSRNGQ